ncbi:P-loop NTPase fold protein [Bradyrhizobium sp. OK095]|uniref:KAP family P-loop NTPase fold protein n=1 Tax=Bradyrhizobium sp. OK095 TaxID=1882760 RepID=UPI000B81B4F4|nr:P-loop NTPase fold protein [Bradyrhizobium sp. OK095]
MEKDQQFGDELKYSDRPIVRPGEDVLGRAPFALALARAIDGMVLASDGFVIAINGSWGLGKTSVVELTLRFLAHLEMERASNTTLLGDESPYPKNMTELEELASSFDKVRDKITAYDELNLNVTAAQRNHQLGLFRSWLRDEDEANKADQYWRLYRKIEGHRRTIQVRFSPWVIAGRAELASVLFSELARALGDRLGSDVKDAFASIISRLAELAPVAGAGLDLVTPYGAGKLFSAGVSWSSKVAASSIRGPTLDQLRDTLKRRLRDLKDQRILVIIDDLDRLMPSEAVEMVSLVKSLGDLPNVIYLLSYDENNLARLIKEGIKLDGREFLSKIVQYSVDLPIIGKDKMGELFEADLISIAGSLTDEQSQRLSAAWYFVIRHYLRTPRDVRLYANSIAMAWSAESDHVDIVDLLLIEALRLHERNLHDWVRDNLEELTQ